jgi:hypothetical protein
MTKDKPSNQVEEPETPAEPEPDPTAMSDFDVFATWVPEETPINMVPSHWESAVAKTRSARRDDADKGDADEAIAAVKELFPDAPASALRNLVAPPKPDPEPVPAGGKTKPAA